MCTGKAPIKGFGKRLFARSLASSDLYQDQLYGEVKKELLHDVSGLVVEIGAGTGSNLPYLPENTSWIGIEPNPHMHKFVYQRAAYLKRDIHLQSGYAETLDFEADSVDVLISTLVLCSVKDQDLVLKEVLRVLKPGGKFIFIEHVAAEAGSALRRIQGLMRPLWRLLADGCNPDRKTGAAIEAAGFTEVSIKSFAPKVPLTIRLIRPHVMGTAIK